MRMRYIVICGLQSSTIFSALPHKRHFLFLKKKKGKLLDIKNVLIFSTKFDQNISHPKKN